MYITICANTLVEIYMFTFSYMVRMKLMSKECKNYIKGPTV